MRTRLFVFLLCISLVSLFAFGQDSRATVTGAVTDISKAAIPNAVVTVRNLDTNGVTTVKTSGTGKFTVPFLKPGQRYEISVEAPGFKTSVYPAFTLQVAQTANVDIEMQVGAAAEQITVTGEAPLLETTKADRGDVINNKSVTEMPLNGRNPFYLASLAAGVTFEGGSGWEDSSLPFENYNNSMFSVNGTKNASNEFLLDGAPNNAFIWAGSGNGVGYVPPPDSVQEFKVMTNAYDAQYGRTAGGVVNVQLKSGANQLHGSVYEFARRSWLDANTWDRNYWLAQTGDKASYGRPQHKNDQYGFEIDGPVYIPKVYDGRNKTFFMTNFEIYKRTIPNAHYITVPDPAFLQGDFRNLTHTIDVNGNPTQVMLPVYDPFTSHQDAQGNWVRDQVSCNGVLNVICPNRLNQTALKLLNYYPKPNTTNPDPWGEKWQNNYYDGTNVTTNDYKSWVMKIDHNFSDRDKTFFRYAFSHVKTNLNDNGVHSGPAQNGWEFEQVDKGFVGDWVHTFSPTLLADFRGSVNRYWRKDGYTSALGFDITTLGFPSSLANGIALTKFPFIEPDEYAAMGRNYYRFPNNAFAFGPNLTWVKGSHTIKTGVDFRVTQYAQKVDWDGGLHMWFNRTATRQNVDVGDDGTTGNTIASMLLGIPNSVSVTNTLFPFYSWRYLAPWIQDDWKVTEKLTLNLGFRWDFNGAVRERFDRMNYAFNFGVRNPIDTFVHRPPECQAQANGSCTAYPNAGTIMGGVTFAGLDGNPRSPYALDKNNLQPRIGFAYELTRKTVIRGGYGVSYQNPDDYGNSYGFAVTTPYVNSVDGGRTYLANLSNPYPSGVLQPVGSRDGYLTRLGQSVTYRNPKFQIPHAANFSLSVQRELPKNGVLEVSYVGTRSYQQQTSFNAINEPSWEFRKSCDVNYGGKSSNCTDRVPNPFYQVPGVTGSLYASPTISKYTLNRPYPAFGGITEALRNTGKTWYNSLQATYKQNVKDLTLTTTYTFSKNMEAMGYQDNIARIPDRTISSMNRTHRLTATAVYQLPFGKGKLLFNNAGRALDMLVGGWEIGGMAVLESGTPWALPDGFVYLKDAHITPYTEGDYIYGVSPCVETWNGSGYSLSDYSVEQGCTSANFRKLRPTSYGTRVIQRYDSHITTMGYRNLDLNLSKRIQMTERIGLQLRLEAFNALNHPIFWGGWNTDAYGDFGRAFKPYNVSNQPRYVQLGAKINW